MIPEAQHTALLVFCRSDREEALNKAFSPRPGRKANEAISRALTRHTLHTATASGMPVYVFSSGKQEGDSFGERLSAAFSSMFKLGYTSVISIGNDCPRLHTDDLQKAVALLEKGQSVLGPDYRGGTYLIGLHKNSFDKAEFARLPWNSPSLLNALGNWIVKRSTKPFLLSQKRDINTAADLQKLLEQKTLSFRLRNSLLKILSNYHLPDLAENIILEICGGADSFYMRGPPAC